MSKCTWVKQDGRWCCQATMCVHYGKGGTCKLGKVSLTCDNNDCKHNKSLAPGVYGCQSMDIHLNADGKCLGVESKCLPTGTPGFAVGNQKIQNQPLGPS